MTPRERVMAVLRHEKPDRIPFVVFDNKLPMCTDERTLRNRGLCVASRVYSYTVHYPNVKKTMLYYTDTNDKNLVKTVFETPVGTLSKVEEPTGVNSWQYEHLFKSEDDYAALLFLVQDTVFKPEYARSAQIKAELGEDFVVRDGIPIEPIQIIISSYMGVERFCYEWMDNRDMVITLAKAILDVNRKACEIVANGPLDFALCGANAMPLIIGKDIFKEYYIPYYNECAAVMHKHNKLVGAHMDGGYKTVLAEIANCGLDYLESYDIGMDNPSLKESKEILGDKVLWLNWPSAWQLNEPTMIEELTVRMLEDGGSGDNIIVGIIENIPPERWRDNYIAIMDGMYRYENNIANSVVKNLNK